MRPPVYAVAALFWLSGCDLIQGDVPARSVGFASSPPSPIEAGVAFQTRATGSFSNDPGAAFNSAEVLIVKGGFDQNPLGQPIGDTLFYKDLNIQSGSSSFDVPIDVLIEEETVTAPTSGWMLVVFEVANCRTDCETSTGVEVSIVP